MSENRDVEIRDDTLVRGIRPWHVSLIALGGIIGSCYFLGLGATFSEMGAGAVVITYAIVGFTIFAVMQSFSELLVNIPRRGSFVSYTREFMGDTASVGVGWAYWANWVVYIPSEAVAAATFINAFIKDIVPDKDTHLIHVLTGNWMTFWWGVIVLAILTFINLYQVKWFGHVESILAIIKIAAIVLFILFGLAIFFGLVGNGGAHLIDPNNPDGGYAMGSAPGKHFLGLSSILEGDGSTFSKFFPSGAGIIIAMMIWTLVNFQGSEIVGLSASETQNPEKNVPRACKNVAYRIILIYLVPIVILCLIMPHMEATIDDSVFSQALIKFGFKPLAGLFTVVTFIAAFSCANSGFYGTVRSLYGLSSEGMAPRRFSRLNRFHTPQNATLITLGAIWLAYILTYAMEQLNWLGGANSSLYLALIGISGFTGTLCWIGILIAQARFRQKLVRRGYSPAKDLKVRAMAYPWICWISIVIQAGAMILLIFDWTDGGIPIFVLSMDITIIPVTIFAIQKYRGKIRETITMGSDEVLFEDKFPDKTGRDTKPGREITIGGGNVYAIVLGVCTVISVALSFVVMHLFPQELAPHKTMFTDPKMVHVWLVFVLLVVTYVIEFLCIRALHHMRAHAPANHAPANGAGGPAVSGAPAAAGGNASQTVVGTAPEPAEPGSAA